MNVFVNDQATKKDDLPGLRGWAFLFWCCAGLFGGGGLGIYLVGYSETAVPIFMLVAAVIGGCIGFYAASAETQLAWVLRLPGYPFSLLAALAGV
jgi:hypothetical protein